MKTDETKTCSVCGMPFSAASEFCPACMLRIGLKGAAESGESSSEQASSEPTQPELEAQRIMKSSSAKTAPRSSWVVVPWVSLIRRLTSIFGAW
jgi:hypothetical protein